MAIEKYGLTLAAKEHLASGKPLTRLEALVLYGVSNFPDVIKEMRNQGWTVESRAITFAEALRRVNYHATLIPPKELPIRNIMLTDYWIPK